MERERHFNTSPPPPPPQGQSTMTLGDHSDEEETNAKNRDQGSSSSPNSSVNDERRSELLLKELAANTSVVPELGFATPGLKSTTVSPATIGGPNAGNQVSTERLDAISHEMLSLTSQRPYGLLKQETGEGHFVTTKAWDSIHLSIKRQKSVRHLNYEVPMGMVDSGICPRARSRWFKGVDIEGESFIPRQPRNDITDHVGHGTKVASIIAGNTGAANFGHLRKGLARGGLLKPKMYIFKTNARPRTTKDAISAAAKKNLAVLNISLSFPRWEGQKTFSDPISRGTFRAMRNGILPVAAVGNGGEKGETCNYPSWIFTATGYKPKWKLVTWLTLSNHPTIKIKGHSRNLCDNSLEYELVLHEEAIVQRSINNNKKDKKRKKAGQEVPLWDKELDISIFKGKIVVSTDTAHETVAKHATEGGAEGIILLGETDSPTANCFASIPCVCVSVKDGEKVLTYIEETRRKKARPMGKIWKTVEELDEKFPMLADLSSRCRDKLSGFMLKPDIGGIALDVLCATIDDGKDSVDADNLQSVTLASGTSMATAMVSSIVGYVKSYRQSWSDSAIKSAIMTTATLPKEFAKLTDRLSAGCGVPNPNKALRVALVYETTVEEHCAYAQSFDDCEPRLFKLTRSIHIASDAEKEVWNINYPSFMATLRDGVTTWSFKRRLKFLGDSSATFEPRTKPGMKNLKLHVDKQELYYTEKDQELPFTLSIKVEDWNEEGILHGEIIWVHTQRGSVRYSSITSPIVIVRGK